MHAIHIRKKRKVDLDSIIEEHNARESRVKTKELSAEHAASKTRIGSVEQFYSKIRVVGVTLESGLKAGDIIEIGTDEEAIRQRVASLQIDGKNVNEAYEGDSVGIKLKYPVSVGSVVYRLD